MQQPMNTNPVQVVVFAQPVLIDKQSIYKYMKNELARKLIGLGVWQVLIGVLCIIFQGIAVGILAKQRHYHTGLDFIGHGFWNGLMFLLTGSFGIAGGIRRSRCQVVTFNVLSILSAVFAVSLIGIAIPGAIIYAGKRYCDYFYYSTTSSYNSYNPNSGYWYYDCYTSGTDKTGMAMETMMAILGLIEVIIAIRSSVICCTIGACCCKCGDSCCCPPSPPQNQFLMTGQSFPGQQQIIIANQQQSGSIQQPLMFLPNQPSTFEPNSQQMMFSLNPQQPIINLAPEQQMVQYNPQQHNPPPYSQLAAMSFSPATGDQGSYTGIQNAIVAPEQPEIHGHTVATDDDVPILDNEEN